MVLLIWVASLTPKEYHIPRTAQGLTGNPNGISKESSRVIGRTPHAHI